MFRGVFEGRIREEKLRVDLYLWFTEWKAGGRQMFFPVVHRSHHTDLRRHFGVNPATLSIQERSDLRRHLARSEFLHHLLPVVPVLGHRGHALVLDEIHLARPELRIMAGVAVLGEEGWIWFSKTLELSACCPGRIEGPKAKHRSSYKAGTANPSWALMPSPFQIAPFPLRSSVQ